MWCIHVICSSLSQLWVISHQKEWRFPALWPMHLNLCHCVSQHILTCPVRQSTRWCSADARVPSPLTILSGQFLSCTSSHRGSPDIALWFLTCVLMTQISGWFSFSFLSFPFPLLSRTIEDPGFLCYSHPPCHIISHLLRLGLENLILSKLDGPAKFHKAISDIMKNNWF